VRFIRMAGTAATLALLLATQGRADNAADDAVAAWLAAWNGAPDRLDAAVTADFVDRTALLPLDRALFAGVLVAWRTALPDLQVTLLERTSAADHEILRLRYEGHPADPQVLAPLSGGVFVVEQVERLALRDGRIAARQATWDDWTGPAELMFVPPPAAPFEPYAARTIAEFAPGTFIESVALSPAGQLYASTAFDGGIVIVAPSGEIRPFARLDVGPGGLVMCLAFAADGTLFASANSRDPAVHGVWRFTPDGRGTHLASLPPGTAPNGVALDGHGGLLVAESFGGAIWRVPTDGGPAVPWLSHPWLAPRPLLGRFPGANGLQRMGDAVVVASSDRSLLIRVPIKADGSAGEPGILASALPGDDFAIAADGSLYVTTHPFNTVVRLTPDGRRVVIAGPRQGVIGPTSAAFGADGALYVGVDGGVYRPLPGVPPVAKLVRLELPRAH
jgi:SnoaL-like polyketide cyclase